MTFRQSLQGLVEKMNDATPHFVRCIKPNLQQDPGSFDTALVEAQLRYAGVLETVRIRRDGYPVRIEFAEFVRRYQMLAFGLATEIDPADTKGSCVKILSSQNIQPLWGRAGVRPALLGHRTHHGLCGTTPPKRWRIACRCTTVPRRSCSVSPAGT